MGPNSSGVVRALTVLKVAAMVPLPVAVERRLVALPRGYRRGYIDGAIVVYSPRTEILIDVVWSRCSGHAEPSRVVDRPLSITKAGLRLASGRTGARRPVALTPQS